MSGNHDPIDVLGFGYACQDTLVTVSRYPVHNSKTRALTVNRQGGGQTATALVALSRWGLKTMFVGSVGDDPEGVSILEGLQKENVDISLAVVRKSCPSHSSFILIDELTGERTIVWHRSESLNLYPSDLHIDDFPAVRAVHMDGHEREADLAIARWAASQGALVSIDLENSIESVAAIAPHVTILIQSSDALPGHTTPCMHSAQLENLRLTNIPLTGMTFGDAGTIIQDAEQRIHIPAISVDVVDTTGAGDVFHAAILFGMLNDWSLQMTGTFAVVASGLSCREIGGRTGIPDLEQVIEHSRFREFAGLF